METKRPGPAGETVDTPQHRALASESRVGILRLVRASESGMTTGEVAAATKLHLSTARAHLDRLVGAGLLVRARHGGGVPGRPAWRYRAAAPDPAPAPYRALAAALLQHLADTDYDARGTAVRAGRGWGLHLAESHTEADPVTAVVRVLTGLGFDPKLLPLSPGAAGRGRGGRDGSGGRSGNGSGRLAGATRPLAGTPTPRTPFDTARAGGGADPADRGAGGAEVHLQTCPFMELVADHADTMCGLHLGVVQGVLTGSGATRTEAEMLPFGAPDACVLRLVDEPEPHP